MRFALAALAGIAVSALAPAASALTVETKISPEFQAKLEKDYGVREANILADALAAKVEARFAKTGAKADRVVVTIHDAKPNRPTFHQISEKPGLDPIRSISIGGARVSGIAYDASGSELGSLEYDWYETDITQVLGNATWSDARWSFDRFARRFAAKLG